MPWQECRECLGVGYEELPLIPGMRLERKTFCSCSVSVLVLLLPLEDLGSQGWQGLQER